MKVIRVQHALARVHLERLADKTVAPANGRSARRALVLLLLAEVTKGANSASPDDWPLLVPLSTEALELSIAAMPLFADVGIGFTGSTRSTGDDAIWESYLPDALNEQSIIFIGDVLTETAHDRLISGAKLGLDRGASQLKAGFLLGREAVISRLADTELPVEVFVLG